MQIKNIKKYIDFFMEGSGTIDLRKKLLMEHRKEIIAHINALNEKRENDLLSYYTKINQ